MYKRYLFFLLLLSIISCKNETTEEIYYPSGGLKFTAKLNNGIRDGIAYEYYENGEIKSILNWKKGKPNGEGKHFYDNGKLRFIEHWQRGKPQGLRKEYYKSGGIKNEGNFFNNHQIGTHNFYFENGKLMEVDYYDSLGNALDFEKYDSLSNLRENVKNALTHLNKDTINMGEEIILTGHLGNNVHRVNMIIGEDYNEEGLLKDTLAIIYPLKGKDGCVFKYKPNKPGENYLVGFMQEITNLPDGSINLQLYHFQQGFFVKD